MLKKIVLLAVFVFLFGISGYSLALATEAKITVFAAASTTNALTEIGKAYEAAGHGKVTFSFASSSTLAKQIENGAPVDIFLSANEKWMDYLAEKDLLEKDSRQSILGNSLVLIAPASSKTGNVAVSSKLDLLALLGKDGRIAVGDPAHVPVGNYAQTALKNLGLWDKVESRILPAKDVRAGMALVERAEAPLGIVYGSDAVISSKIKVIGTFPADSHPKVEYPVAVIKKSKISAAQGFIKFMRSDDASDIWKKYGFEVR